MSDVEKPSNNFFIKDLINQKEIGVEDLYPFSPIKLKKKRNLKKFRKYYRYYLSDDLLEMYDSALYIQNLIKSISIPFCDIPVPDITPFNGPTPKLIYFDYQYQSE